MSTFWLTMATKQNPMPNTMPEITMIHTSFKILHSSYPIKEKHSRFDKTNQIRSVSPLYHVILWNIFIKKFHINSSPNFRKINTRSLSRSSKLNRDNLLDISRTSRNHAQANHVQNAIEFHQSLICVSILHTCDID